MVTKNSTHDLRFGRNYGFAKGTWNEIQVSFSMTLDKLFKI